jgi:hypothetical protein
MVSHAHTVTSNAKYGFSRRLRARLLPVATGGLLLAMAATSSAATLVTDHIVNETAHKQDSVSVTFGQVFGNGDVPHGVQLAATLGGRPVTLQVDAKASNPDGSLRHAVLTVLVPSLRGRAMVPLALSVAAGGGPNRAAASVSLSQLLATRYDATASFDFGGTMFTADARELLQAAAATGTCGAWDRQCNLWLSGPLVSEWVVHGPVTAADGTVDPGLHVYFAVRAYAGASPGTIGRVRTDIVVENTDAFAPQAQPQYTASLASGSANYTSPALTQYAYTRWHKVLWWNAVKPDVYLRQDTTYIQSSKAISRYMTLKPDAKFLAGLRQACAPLDHCDQTQSMGSTGAQAAIGPLPRWTSVYIVDPDVRAYHWMLANTDALGAYSIHYRDRATGFPVSIQKHPRVTIANWAAAAALAKRSDAVGKQYQADLLQQCVDNAVVHGCAQTWYRTGNPNRWDNAHQPAQSYVPYMVTGSWYYMSELAFAASMNTLWPNDTYRGLSKGLIDRGYGQVRGKAWVLRQVADAAWLLPDGYPLKTEFNAVVNDSLADWNASYTHNPEANPLGLMRGGAVYDVHDGKRNGMAPWQHNFLTWSVGHAADLGFAGAAAFRDWLAKFEIGLMTDWKADPAHGYCWLQASAYKIQVKDATGHWLPSFSAVYVSTFPTLAGLACNAPAMVAAMGKLKKQPWRAGEMSGYPYSATGFPANFQIGLASAVDSGLPHAREAWELFESRGAKPKPPHGYDDYPNFAVMPRSVPR